MTFMIYCTAMYAWIPSIWIVFVVVFWEGLLGGSTYVNAFHNVARNVDPLYREFSMGRPFVPLSLVCMYYNVHHS